MTKRIFCSKCEKVIQRRIKELNGFIRLSGGKKAPINKERLFIIEQLEWLLEQ